VHNRDTGRSNNDVVLFLIDGLVRCGATECVSFFDDGAERAIACTIKKSTNNAMKRTIDFAILMPPVVTSFDNRNLAIWMTYRGLAAFCGY